MKKFVLLILVFNFTLLHSQSKNLTIEDIIFYSNSSLAPTNLSQINFIKGTNYFYYIENNTLILNNDKSEINTLITLDKLNNLFKIQNFSTIKNFPKIDFLSLNTFVFSNNNTYFSYNTETDSLSKLYSLPSEAENIEMSEDYSTAVFTLDNNVYFSLNGNIAQLSNEKNQNIIYGHSVHRNEFGIEKGIFLSPNAKLVAFYRMDQTMVTDYPILDIDSLPAQVRSVKYPMAGGKSHEVTIGVYNSLTKNIVYLETGPQKEQYLTCVTWSPDNQFIFVAILNRDQNHMDLCKFDAISGKKIKTLFSEDDNKFVEPEHPLYFLSGNNNKFIWSSKRDGWNHLYIYDTDGNLINQLTKGQYEITEIIGFDEKNKNLFYISTEKTPLERHLYKININTLKAECLTNSSGMHDIIFSEGEYLIDKYNSLQVPNKITLISKDGKNIKDILNSKNPLEGYSVSIPKILTLKEDGKVDLFARIILPTDFDSTKKYPVIVYVYGGPHSQEITNSWILGRYNLWFQYMAQKGFIVFSIDNRGTSFRGDDFAKATFGELGTVEIEDHLRGVAYLKTLNYVDINRLGVYGWSYGGFMTTSLMLKTNNTFKVGACGGAVIDWKYYEIMYTERYMDTPQTNPQGYEKSNLLNYINNLNGKLLLVHGTSDDTVVWQHTLLFVKKATSLNKPLDYYPYIHHPHGVRGKDALHLYNKISDYFINNL